MNPFLLGKILILSKNNYKINHNSDHIKKALIRLIEEADSQRNNH